MESPVMRLSSRPHRQFTSRLSVDCYIPLDSTLPLDHNIVTILDHVLSDPPPAKPRLLGHLNNLVTLLRKKQDFSLPVNVLLSVLKVLLVNESKELRTAGLRCIRYTLRSRNDVRVFYQCRVEYFVVRCLDVVIDNETERVQALKLIRHLISLDPSRVPRVVVHSLGSVCESGDDGLRLACVETICELAIMNPKAFGDYDVINRLLHSAMDIDQSKELTKTIFRVILHVLNRTEAWSSLDLEYVISPLMEVYFHRPKVEKVLPEEKVTNRLKRCRMALNTILQSWTGVSRLCTPSPCGIRSLINLLCISNTRVQMFIMEVIFQQLFGRVPYIIDDYSRTVEKFILEDSKYWSLQEGFVVTEGYYMLDSRVHSSFLDHHRSLILTCLLQTGLCETLVDVTIGSRNETVEVMSTLLLAEVLELSQRLVPAMYESVSVCTSSLLSTSASDQNLTVKSKARQTVNRLLEHQTMKHKHSDQISLFLQALVFQTRSEKPIPSSRDGLEPVEPVLRDFQAMSPRDSRVWDWDIISMVLEYSYDLPKNGEDEGHFRFLRRLVHFFKPSSRFYAVIRLDEDYAHSLTVLACQLVVFLIEADNSEGSVILYDFLSDIAECLKAVQVDVVTGDPLMGPNRIRNSLSQHYFLIIGHLTHYSSGEKYLERSGLVEMLLQLISITNHSEYVKLAISAQNYVKNPTGKVLLCKALTGACEEARIYSCHFLALLMKMKIPGVNDWGMNLLVTQLLDQSLKVAETALKILENLCEDAELLDILVSTLPPLMHLSEKGVFLLARLMSIPTGFKMFTEAKVLGPEPKRWQERMNEEYVHLDERHREQVLSEGDPQYPSGCYPLIHLYGQLVQHDEGFDLVTKQDCISDYIQSVKSATTASTNLDVLRLKTSLWVLGHLGSSGQGAEWLETEGVLSMILTLSTCSSNLTVRATAFCAVNLITKTDRGRLLVERYGWASLLHERPRSSSRTSSSFSSSSGSFTHDFFPDSFRKPLFTVSSCPEVHEGQTVDITRERGQSDSVIMNHTYSPTVPRSNTVPACRVETTTSNSEPIAKSSILIDRSVSVTETTSRLKSSSEGPAWSKTGTVRSDPGYYLYRPYNRSHSALVGSEACDAANLLFTNNHDKGAKMYLVEKISGKKTPNRGLCVPVPVWNLFKFDPVKREVPDTVLEDSQLDSCDKDTYDDVIKRIYQMCGIRSQKFTENELLKLKQKSPEIFQDEKLYERICQILNDHYFGPGARRFVQELFLDLDFCVMMQEIKDLYQSNRPKIEEDEFV